MGALRDLVSVHGEYSVDLAIYERLIESGLGVVFGEDDDRVLPRAR